VCKTDFTTKNLGAAIRIQSCRDESIRRRTCRTCFRFVHSKLPFLLLLLLSFFLLTLKLALGIWHSDHKLLSSLGSSSNVYTAVGIQYIWEKKVSKQQKKSPSVTWWSLNVKKKVIIGVNEEDSSFRVLWIELSCSGIFFFLSILHACSIWMLHSKEKKKKGFNWNWWLRSGPIYARRPLWNPVPRSISF